MVVIRVIAVPGHAIAKAPSYDRENLPAELFARAPSRDASAGGE
jgi:hypothetical protein